LLLFYFRKEKKRNANEKKCALYGEDAITERMYQRWFAKSCWWFSLDLSNEYKRFYDFY